MTNPIPYTNEFGQNINPGDRVIVVTNSSHRIETRTGTYVGMSSSGAPQITAKFQRWTWFVKGTDTQCTYYLQADKEYHSIEVDRISTISNGLIYPFKENQ